MDETEPKFMYVCVQCGKEYPQGSGYVLTIYDRRFRDIANRPKIHQQVDLCNTSCVEDWRFGRSTPQITQETNGTGTDV